MTTNYRPSGHPLANGSLEHTWLLDDEGCGTLRSNARHRGGSCGATGSVIRMADGCYSAAVRGSSKRFETSAAARTWVEAKAASLIADAYEEAR